MVDYRVWHKSTAWTFDSPAAVRMCYDLPPNARQAKHGRKSRRLEQSQGKRVITYAL